MFDLGWTEMLVVGVVALIVIGPKDLPVVFRNVGRWVGKARGMAREFSRAMNDAAKDSGVNEISQGLKAAANPKSFGVDKIKEATGITAATAALTPEQVLAKNKMDEGMAKAAEAREARKAEREAKAAKAEEAAPKSTPDSDT